MVNIANFKTYIKEDPDDYFVAVAIPFILWDKEADMKSDFQTEDDKVWKEFKSKYKLSFPLVAGLKHKVLYFNNKKTSLIAPGDYHDAIIEILTQEEPEVINYKRIRKDGHQMGVTSGRVMQQKPQDSNISIISFWNEPIDDKIITTIIKNTKKYISYKKEIEYEQAPKGYKNTRRGYGDGTVASYKKGVKSFKAGKGDDVIDKVRDQMFGPNVYEANINEGFFKKVVSPKAIKATDRGYFSGWYIPKEDTLIKFDFARHDDFTQKYWPRRSADGIKPKTLFPPYETDTAINNIVKKYSKSILKSMEKSRNSYADYQDFYNEGWIKINYDSGFATVSFNKKGKKESEKLLKYLLDEDEVLYFQNVAIENVDGGTESLTAGELEERLRGGNVSSPVADIRSRMFGPGIYESRIDEKVNKNSFKKYIEMSGTMRPKKDEFSAWYDPKTDSLIKFYFAGHNQFMFDYWPRFEGENIWDAPDRIKPPRYEDKKLVPLVKKYYKDIEKWLQKNNDTRTRYETFYEMGWIRINYEWKASYITHNNAKQDYIKKLILFLKNDQPELEKIVIEKSDKSSIFTVNAADVPDDTKEVMDIDIIDAVRGHMFGFQKYMGESFNTLYEKIMNEGEKISFDFDITLSGVKGAPNMSMVKELKDKAKTNQIVILTSRKQTPDSLKEIKNFIKKHKLPVEDIIFTSGMYKAPFIERMGISFHYDDDPAEIRRIGNKKSKLIEPDQNIKDEFEEYYDVKWVNESELEDYVNKKDDPEYYNDEFLKWLSTKLGKKIGKWLGGGVEGDVYALDKWRVIKIQHYNHGMDTQAFLQNKAIPGVAKIYSTGIIELPKRFWYVWDRSNTYGRGLELDKYSDDHKLAYVMMERVEADKKLKGALTILDKIYFDFRDESEENKKKTLHMIGMFSAGLEFIKASLTWPEELKAFKDWLKKNDKKSYKLALEVEEVFRRLKDIGIEWGDSHAGNWGRDTKGNLVAIDVDEGFDVESKNKFPLKNIIKEDKNENV